MREEQNSHSGVKTRTLFPFLMITFGLTWGIAALLILFTDEMGSASMGLIPNESHTATMPPLSTFFDPRQ